MVHSILGVSHGAITATTQRALRVGLVWDLMCALSDADLELRLYPPPLPTGTPRPKPDWAQLDLELRKKGATIELRSQEHLGSPRACAAPPSVTTTAPGRMPTAWS